MVKVTFQTWNEVIIHETIQETYEYMVRSRCIGVPAEGLARPFNWAEGILFSHASMPPTEDVVREQLIGKVHWGHVRFTLMPEYKDIILIPDLKVRIPVRNVSSNAILSEVARELRKIGIKK